MMNASPTNSNTVTEPVDLVELMSRLGIGENAADYLSEDFDVKQHANTVLQSGIAISDQLAKISEGIILLNKELHSQVVAHHDNLLAQATGVETLEGVLQVMHNRIQSLLSTTERIRSKVSEPFNRITIRMNQLIRLQETCDMLRRVIRILYLTKRLRAQLKGGARELTKTAQSLSELRLLSENVDLSGIEVLETDRRIIAQAKVEVHSQAEKMLNSGMSSLNQNQVGTALQVFYNLNLLCETVNSLLEDCRSGLERSIDQALSQNNLTGGIESSRKFDAQSAPGKVNLPVNSAVFRANLWAALERLMDNIYNSLSQVSHLQKVLSKKRDPVTQALFITEYSRQADPNIVVAFWVTFTEMLNKKLLSAANNSNLIKQAMEGEFPKLLRLLTDLWGRVGPLIVRVTESSAEVNPLLLDDTERVQPDPKFNAEEMLREAVFGFNTAYLSRSLSRLFDPINLIFPQNSLSVPSLEEVDGIVKTIDSYCRYAQPLVEENFRRSKAASLQSYLLTPQLQTSSELSVAVFDSKLALSVAKNVAKTIKMFAVKCEQLLSTDGEASQVIESSTPGQKRNAEVVNSLHHLQTTMTRLLDSSLQGYNQNCIHVIMESVKGLSVLMKTAVEPLLSSINDSMEAIIFTMHQEDFSSQTPSANESQCSLYMRELQGFLNRVSTDYLSQYECGDFILDCMQPYVCNGIELFVRHASLIRPMGEGGKMRLAADFAQMELAVHPLCKRVGDLGKSYKLLRAFRPLLFQANEHILQNHAVGDIIPYSTVLHFLFSRAPEQLKSPHQVAGWSISRYTNWLENHPSENDRLTLIKGALEAYVKSVHSSGGTTYAAVYPLMLEVLQKGLKE